MSTPRKAKVDITYIKQGIKTVINTAAAMAEYEESFSYCDVATGESDTMSLTVCNRDMRWLNKWMPEKGDKMLATIKVYSWDDVNVNRTFLCGKFCCDDLSYSGPTLTCKIGGVSVPEGQAFRTTERSETWNNVTILEIASEIAARYSLTVQYDAADIKLETMEQSSKTDSDFLNSLCSDYGLNIKVYYGKIVIYDADIYEDKDAVATYSIYDLLNWSYNTTITGTYTGATIKYTNGDNDEELTLTVGSGNRILNVSEKVDNIADAQRKACAKVNSENRSAVTMTATIKADLKIVAGVCINVIGGYNLNGKYFVDKVTHNIDAEGAYTMDLELHQVQEKITVTATESKSTTADDALAVGDQVTVSGPAYYAGNGGRSVSCSGTYYITQILGANYKYQIGIAKRKGGTRYGWCAKSEVTKV